MREAYNWNYPDVENLDDRQKNTGVFHAALNANFSSTLYSEDVEIREVFSTHDLYCINFKNSYDSDNKHFLFYENHSEKRQSQSNESAVAKQAYALGLMIKRVLDVTGAEKVVLFGHSMGGLAAREYLQRTDANGKPQWWVDKSDTINGHKVAKLVTFGTPHLGSNASDWGALLTINPNSEAARDLHYNYSDSYIYGRGYDDGVFLFGGSEQYGEMRDDNYHNYDINCDGDEDDQNINGLNSTLGDWAANPKMSLPVNIDYSWIASDNGVGGDEAVKLERQYIKSHGDILFADRNHLTETKDEYSIIRGLDEPGTRELAYNIKLGKKYHLFSTYQSGNSRLDVDWLHFSINQSNVIKFSIEDIPVNHITNMSVRLYEKESNTRLENIEWDKQQNSIVFYKEGLDKPDYYLQIVTELPEGGSDSYKYPFVVKVEYIGAVSKLFSYAVPLSMEADNVSKSTIHTEIRDPYGNLVGTATNEIAYKIVEGQSYGVLSGDTPVKASGGIAAIQLQATNTSGRIRIACSSPGLVSDTVTVYTYEAGFSTRVGGRISKNTIWTIANSPYEVTKDITIDEGVVLSVEPGVIVKLRKDVDIFVKGGLNAVGTEYNKIVFTSSGDQIAGYWGGLNFKETTLDDRSALKYCEFYYGGSSSYGESGYPIVLDLRANPSISHTSIKNSRRNAIGIRGGSYSVDIYLNNPGLPLWLNSDLTIEAGATLTIDPGVILKLYKDVDIFVKGGFYAKGSPSQPIILTSYKDDARGGDSNNDGSSLAPAGSWGGLNFKETALDDRSVLKYCEFYYGGSSSYGESGYPIVLDLRANPAISHTTIENSRRNAIGIRSGSYAVDVHLNNPGLPLWLNSDLTIEAGATLTIDPGIIIKLYKDVDVFIKGGFNARGTAANPIIFTSYKDDARGGDSNNDGSSLPLAGTWGGLNFKGSTLDDRSALKFCEFYYGGSSSYGESGYPIVLDLRANPEISHTTIENSRRNAIGIRSGSYTVDVHLNNPGLPLWLNSDLTIDTGAILTIDAGVLIKLYREVDIFIMGGIQVNGTKSAPVVFTSYKDDSRGGDSNNDGSSLPLAGTWGGLNFKKSSRNKGSVLRYCEFYYGGNNSYGESGYPLVINDSNPLIEKAVLNFSRLHGIYLINNAQPDLGGGETGSVGGNRFIGFLAKNKYAIYNNSSANVYAENNFWDTNEILEIEEQIYDYYDNSEKGVVYFQPFERKNTAPSVFHLLNPENHDTLTNREVLFSWEEAEDSEKDTLFYDLHIWSNNQDTLIDKIEQTYFNFIDENFFEKKEYYWSVTAGDSEFTSTALDTFTFTFETITGFSEVFGTVPLEYNLFQNYPNPFNPTTVITYQIKHPSFVTLIVYDILGREVDRLVEDYKLPGKYSIRFYATDQAGGVYIYRLKAGKYERSKKFLILR